MYYNNLEKKKKKKKKKTINFDISQCVVNEDVRPHFHGCTGLMNI
jgi:hypothetical protein